MMLLKIIFWLIATPYLMIIVGVVWLWILSLITRALTGGE
jgi:hypothetical protein